MLSTPHFANHSLVDLSAIMNIQGKDIHKVFYSYVKLLLSLFINGIDFFSILYTINIKEISNVLTRALIPFFTPKCSYKYQSLCIQVFKGFFLN
jgi:hypothetical protein